MQTRARRFALIAALATAAVAYADGGPAPITPDAFVEQTRSGADAPFVLDVRTPEEYVAGHVPGAVNIPHDQLATRLGEVPKDKDVVLYCRSGKRAATAGEVLASNGYTRLQHLEGDMLAWQAQQRPVEVPRDPAGCALALKDGQTQADSCRPD